MRKKLEINKATQLAIDAVSVSLKPIYNTYKTQIKGLSKEEANLIAFEYMEDLQAKLCLARIEEGIRIHKESINTEIQNSNDKKQVSCIDVINDNLPTEKQVLQTIFDCVDIRGIELDAYSRQFSNEYCGLYDAIVKLFKNKNI